MKRSLLFKLILCYIICVSIMFILINTFGSASCASVTSKNFIKKIARNGETLTEDYVKPFINGKSRLNTLTKNLQKASKNMDATIWFVTSNGYIYIDTSGEVTKENSNIFEAAPKFISSGQGTDFSLEHFVKEESIYHITPITKDNQTYYTVVFLPMSQFDDIKSSIMIRMNIIGAIMCPVIMLVFVLIYFLTIYPVHKITKAAMEYSKGHYSYPLEIKAKDEYNELGTAIKYMAGEMNNLDDYQRKFIGNISHDFRSPLTSIKGYIQAMIDGTIPPDNQEKYLNIILFEAERLSELMTNLLTLNNYDHNKKILKCTEFDINYIIIKTAETYEGVCKEKNIEFEFHFENDNFIVWADQSRIQQVLNNLIDNAIKFSPQNSKIEISVYSNNEIIFVSVKDHGIGIASNNINKIWERFFKSDASRGKDKKGTGLGLAITKEIINSHNENISVTSTEGVGTEFTFTLSPRHLTKIKQN